LYSECYNESPPLPKAVTNRFLIKQKNAHAAVGCHSFFYPNIPNPPKIDELTTLCYNHYTVRSSTNLMTKVIPGWLNHLCVPGRETGIRFFFAWNWRHIYDELKMVGTISQELLEICSLQNNISDSLGTVSSIKKTREDIKTISENFDTSFCGDKLVLKYTNYTANKKYVMQIILKQLETNLLNMASWRSAREREVSNEQIAHANVTITNLNAHIIGLNNHIANLNSQILELGRANELIPELNRQIEILHSQVSELTQANVAIPALNAQIAQLTQANAAIPDLNAQIANLIQATEAIYNSWSWRTGHKIVRLASKFFPRKRLS
jgi:hypothetical protein